MNDHNTLSLKDALNKLIDTYKWRGKINEASIIGDWETLFGPTINKYTSKVWINDQKLFLKITSAPLKQELLYNKDKMIKMINDKVGTEYVKEVVLL